MYVRCHCYFGSRAYIQKLMEAVCLMGCQDVVLWKAQHVQIHVVNLYERWMKQSRSKLRKFLRKYICNKEENITFAVRRKQCIGNQSTCVKIRSGKTERSHLVSHRVSICSDNGLPPIRHQAIVKTIFSLCYYQLEPKEPTSEKFHLKNKTFHSRKKNPKNLRVSSAKWRSIYPGGGWGVGVEVTGVGVGVGGWVGGGGGGGGC